MSHLFYFLVLFPLAYELFALTEPKVWFEAREELKSQKNVEELSSQARFAAVIMLAYIPLTLLGFFSHQWPSFLVILLLSTAIKGDSLTWFRTDSIISAVVLLFAILNQYHFHLW